MNGILIDNTSSLAFKLGEAHTTTALDYTVAYSKLNIRREPGNVSEVWDLQRPGDGQSSGITNVTIVSRPTEDADMLRLEMFTLCNRDTVAHTVYLHRILANGSTERRYMNAVNLPVNATLFFRGDGSYSQVVA